MNQGSPRPTNPSIRVLVIDDEEPVRRIVGMALERAGCDVDTAANGRQGLQALLRRTFDVAVVDIRMQEMDGLAFVEEARKIWPWLGIILHSGFIDDPIATFARREGIRHVLNKPVDLHKLVAAVRDEADRRAERDKAAGAGHPISHIGYQLAMMRHITQDIMHARSLLAALSGLGQTIIDIMPCHALGILALEEQENVLLLRNTVALPAEVTDQVKDHMLERYQVLSGKPLQTENLRVERIGPVSSHQVVRGFHSLASVPVLMGEDVRGILTLASCESDAFSDAQISLLYHAAGNLSTLLVAFSEMRRLAVRDPLTGLYNRIQMEEELDKFWNLSLRHRKSTAVLMLDIDHFKSINDQGGHNRGDAALREFARFLKGTVRTSDIVARYGGDEFVIILPHADIQEASQFATRLLGLLRRQRFNAGGSELALTTSIGIAVHDPARNPLRKEQMIDCADQALYQAKKEGRDRFCLWTSARARPASLAEGLVTRPRLSDATGIRGRVLAVDDEPFILDLLARLLAEDGYDVIAAGTAQEARHLLEQYAGRLDLFLCDLSLPDGDGHDLLRQARDLDQNLVSMVISGNVTADNAILAMRNGAFDFIQKPMTPRNFSAQVERAMKFRTLQKENAQYRLHLEEMVHAKNAELSGAIEDIKAAYEFTLETMVAMLDAREFETGQHSLRVRALTIALAQAMGVEGRQLEEIGRGALLHDIGKIGIPDSILLKPGKLTQEEWEIMRRHPEIGHRFLTNSAFLQTAADLVLSHHERWDGTGYPHRLSGPQINLGARIFAVIDAYDAMRSSRVYKQPVGMEQAVAEIRDKSGTQFDPSVVEVFLRCVPELEGIGRWNAPET